MPTTTSLLAFVAQRLRVAASFNKWSLRTTLRENETTLFENRPRTSALDHINANSYSGIRRHGGLQSVTERIASGHQAGPRRRAHRLNVKLFEPGAGFGELVDVRCLDIRAVEADVFPAEIIGDDIEDVRFLSRLRIN